MKTNKYILTLALTVCCALGNLYAINSTYYSSIDGKKDSGLREALTTLLYNNHTTGLSYDWTFDGIDWDNSGNVYDIYSDCGHKKTDATSSYQCCCDAINREHVVPQSTFESKYPQYADRHHLYVVDGKVNGYRSNYAFGECSGGTKGSCNNSSTVKPSEGTATCSNHEFGKLGTSTFTEVKISDKVYEPDDEYKGDIARAIMYMVVRYATADYCKVKSGSGTSANEYPVTAWSASSNCGLMFSSSLSTNYGLSNYGKALLLKWHRNDPVSAREIARNEGVAAKQGNRNPFIDYPCLAEYLWGNKAGETVTLSSLVGTFTDSWTTGDGCPCGTDPAITLPTGDIFVGSTEANSSVTKTITVQGVNLTGNLTLSLSGTNSSLFSLSATSIQKTYAEAGTTVTITYTPTSAGNHSATLTISGGGLASDQTFALSGTCCNPYLVTLSRNGITETFGACGTFTLPTAEDESDACDGWEFAGWLDSNTSFSEGTTTAPTFVTSVSSATTLYAVYGKGSGSGGSSASASVTFLTTGTTSDDGTDNSQNIASNLVDQASGISTYSGSKLYKGKAGMKMGASGSAGSITLNLSSAVTTKTVTIVATKYGSDTGTLSVTANGSTAIGSAQTPQTSESTLTFTTDAAVAISSLTVATSTKRAYVKSITIGGSTSTTTYKKLPCTTYTISYEDEDGIATGGSYQASETTALAGTTISLDYDEAMGYEFTGWTVTNASTSEAIAVTNGQFTMPEANVTVKANFTALCSKLSAPDVTATPGDGQITLTWEDVTGADHYTVSIGTGAGYTTECGGEASIADISHSGTTNTCVISGLTNGLAYTTYVVANGISSVCDSDADEDTATPTANTHIVTFTPSPTGATVTVNDESTSPLSVNYNTTVTVVVTPDAHYTLTTFTVTGESGSVVVSGEGNTRTFTMPDEDVTIAVTMTEDTKYTVNWYVNNGSATSETNYAGEALEGVPEPDIDCYGKVFQGWTTTADYSSEDTAPNDLFKELTGKTMPVGGANYYAVFAMVEEIEPVITDNYQKITSTSELTTGKYLIVGYNNGYNAMSTTWKDTYYLDSKTVTPSNDVITTTDGAIIWNITVSNDQVSIHNETEGYLYIVQSGSYYNIKLGDNTTDNKFTYSVNEGNWLFTSVTYTSRVLEYYTKNTRWAYYTAADAPVYLYKQQCSEGSTTISNYATTCSAPADVTVTFDANGGEGTMADQVMDYNTATALTANSFTRTGYSFAGWATSATGSKAYDDEEPVTLTKNMTLYALWSKNNYNVIFTPSITGATITVNDASTSPQSVEFESTVSIAIEPDEAYMVSSVTATGGVTPSGSGNNWSFTMPASDVTVTVTLVDRPTYTIRFIDNGSIIKTQTVYYGASASKPEDPTHCEGNTFVGWANAPLAEDSDTKPALVTNFTATQDQDYYAVFCYCDSKGSGSTNVTFNFGYADWGKDAAFSSSTYDEVSQKDAGITVTYTRNAGSLYANTTSLRFYKSNELTFNAGDKTITAISFTGSVGQTDITTNVNTCTNNNSNSLSWAGEATSITFTRPSNASSYATLTSATVTIDGIIYYTTAPDCEAPIVTVDTMLVAEYGGARVALAHDNTNTVAALPLMYFGGNYFIPNIDKNGNTVSAPEKATLTWQVAERTDGYYIKSGDKFLAATANGFTLTDQRFLWSKDGGTRLAYDATTEKFVADQQGELPGITPVNIPSSISLTELKSQRDLTKGNFGTICLPHAVALPFTWGVRVYSIEAKKMNDKDELTGIYIVEETEMLTAGKPYLIEAKETQMTMWYPTGAETVTETVSALGLVGNLSTTSVYVPVGCYGISNNKLRRVAAEKTATIGQYKAYIDLTGVPVEGVGISMHSKYKVLYTAEGENVATDTEQLFDATGINWNEPVYNILGIRVDRNCTGVLIQNGKKFLVTHPRP